MAAEPEPSAEPGEAAATDGVSRENAVLRELVTIYHHLTGLALQSADLQAVIELLAERMGCRAAVVGPTLEVLAAAAPTGTPEAAREGISGSLTRSRSVPVLRAVTQTRRALRLPAVGSAPSLVVAPILVGDDILAYLLTVEEAMDDSGEDTSLLVTEHAATICGVIMGRERVVGAAAGRVRDDLVEGLLLGRASDPDEALRWAQHLGYDPSRAHQVMSARLEGPNQVSPLPRTPPEDDPRDDETTARRRRILDSLERFITGRAPAAFVGSHAGEVVVLAPEPTPAGNQQSAPS